MARLIYDGPSGELCWFDSEDADRWSDRDHNGNGSGGTGRGKAVWRTAGGVFVMESWTSWQGEDTTREAIDPETARNWLLANGCDGAVEEYFGPVEAERGPAQAADDPLAVARSWVAQADEIAAYYAARPLGGTEAMAVGAGREQFDLTQRAGYMALVSIAEDLRLLRRHADRYFGDLAESETPGRLPYALSFRDISTGLRETGPVRYGTLGEAVDAYRQARRDDHGNDGLPSTDPRIECDGIPVEGID